MKNLKLIALVLIGIFLVTVFISYITHTESEAAHTSSEVGDLIDTSPTNAIRLSSLNLLRVQNREKTLEVPISGRVVPKNQTQLFAEVQGRVLPTSPSFKAGQYFRSGEVLLRIDSREFALNLEAQRSAFLNLLTGIMPDLKADYPESYEQWLSYVLTYDSGQPLLALPKTNTEHEKFFITANQVYNTYYSIKAQEERLSKYTIRAPYSGLVTQSQVDIGGMASPGQLLGTLISSEDYELEAGINLEASSHLSVGDQLNFSSNEIGGTWTGEVVRINNIIDPQTQNVPVFFRLQGPSLKSGMYLEGAFATHRYQDVFVIPQEALLRDESVLLLKDNVISRKTITPVAYLRDSIFVQGLTENDQIILNEFTMPVEGTKVGL